MAKLRQCAIYGKGGIGKSFTLANLSYMMAQTGKRVLLIGCDPKSDTTSLLFGGRATPTIIETSSKKKAAGEEVLIGDVCFKRDGVFAMELGGPEVGRGCGGRGIIHGFELLEKLGFHEWGFDYVLLDFLGDALEPYYGFRSLLAFKAKFQPEFHPMYLVFPDESALLEIGVAIARAYMPDATLIYWVRISVDMLVPSRTDARS